jgi:hypothetical protein
MGYLSVKYGSSRGQNGFSGLSRYRMDITKYTCDPGFTWSG